jgi:predicted DNA-binding protein
MLLLYSTNYDIDMKKRLDFRVENYEFEFLNAHCKKVGRTKTDVLREFIRSLSKNKLS